MYLFYPLLMGVRHKSKNIPLLCILVKNLHTKLGVLSSYDRYAAILKVFIKTTKKVNLFCVHIREYILRFKNRRTRLESLSLSTSLRIYILGVSNPFLRLLHTIAQNNCAHFDSFQ